MTFVPRPAQAMGAVAEAIVAMVVVVAVDVRAGQRVPSWGAAGAVHGGGRGVRAGYWRLGCRWAAASYIVDRVARR